MSRGKWHLYIEVALPAGGISKGTTKCSSLEAAVAYFELQKEEAWKSFGGEYW